MKRNNFISYVLCLLTAAFTSTSLQAQSVNTDVDAILASMSLEHKVAQMFLVTLHGSVLTEIGAEDLRTWQPGGVVLFDTNAGKPPAMTQLINGYQRTITEAGGVPLLDFR